MSTGDIEPTTYAEYETTCDVIHDHFGKARSLDTLTVQDFQGLRTALAKKQFRAFNGRDMTNAKPK